MDKVKDYYYTLEGKSQGEYKEKGSKFLSYAFVVKDTDEVQDCLETLYKEHPKARHHCYAYRLGMGQNNFRANDDGEPSGTAGRPILGAIDRYQLTNTLLVVVRYFGGTKLGASGLIQAYKEAAESALSETKIVKKFLTHTFTLDFEYSHLGIIMDHVKQLEIPISRQVLENKPLLEIKVRRSQAAMEIKKLKAALLHRSPEDIEDKTEVPFCKITKK